MAVTTYRGWLQDEQPAATARPVRDLALTLHRYGYNVGRLDVIGLGDERHLLADPPQDHCPYSATPWPGPQPYPYVLAVDVMRLSVAVEVPPGAPTLAQLARKLIADRNAGRREVAWVKYLNWTDEQGAARHESWKPNHTTSPTSDRGHLHLSGRTDYHLSDVAAGYDPVAELLGDDVSELTDQIIQAWRLGVSTIADKTPVEPVKWRMRDEAWQAATDKRIVEHAAALTVLGSKVDKLLELAAQDPGNSMSPDDLAQLQAALAEQEQQTRAALLQQLAEQRQAVIDAAATAAREGAEEGSRGEVADALQHAADAARGDRPADS